MIVETLLSVSLLFAAPGAEPVTVMGENLLPKTDLVAVASPLSENRLGLGARVTSIEVTEILHGKEKGRRLVVLSADPEFFGPVGVECVVFLRRLGDGRYEGVGVVELLGTDGKDKLAVLKRYLEIERLEDAGKKRKALHDLLLENLASERPFLVWSAARELAHFTGAHPEAFDGAERAALNVRALDARDPDLRKLLLTSVTNLGGAPAADAEGEVPRGVPVDRRGIPAPREFRALLRAWREGPESADERLRIVRATVARHVRFAEEILFDAIEDEDPRVREAAALGFGEGIVSEAKKPLRLLLATEKEKAVLKAAVQSLGYLEAEEALPAILQLGRDPELTRTAAFAAARIGGPLARDWLATLRTLYAGEGEEDAAMRKTLDFLDSEDFVRQEEILRRLREKRLR